jgi:2-keto-4-pentenoate hydratase/2-oxohepta-3-ene-1,7-dioic acid hydratase in catechol pathway
MRYLTFSLPSDRTQRLGVIDGERILEVPEFTSLLALIQAGPDAWRAIKRPITDATRLKRPAYRNPNEVRWHAPIPRPTKNVFCLGRNYADHVKEAAKARGQEFKLPTHPVFFTKPPTSVIGPYDDIAWDRGLTQQVDWEAELGVIIGIGAKNIRRESAMSHVFGYTVINDVSARDLQSAHVQFFKGKSLDTFCPMGPVVVTADEFGDPQRKALKLRVNGVEKQNGNTADMIFPIDQTIEVLSRGCTLEPGDVISTGTPEGVGMGRTPQEWLAIGDRMETEVEGIGVLRNTSRVGIGFARPVRRC